MIFRTWFSPFALVLAVGFLPLLIGGGMSLFGNWLGGRAKSKQHQRQLASEERRQLRAQQARQREQERAIAAWREYQQAVAKENEALRGRKKDALGGLLGGGAAKGLFGDTGMDIESLIGILSSAGGQKTMNPGMMPGVRSDAMPPLQTAGLPPGGGGGGGGISDLMGMYAENPDAFKWRGWNPGSY